MSPASLSFTAVERVSLLLLGHSAFQLIHAGVALGVFDLLHERPRSPHRIGVELGIDADRTLVLMRGLEALEMVVRDGEFYSNGEAVSWFIASGRWRLLRAFVRFQAEIVYPGQFLFVTSLKRGTNAGVEALDGYGSSLYRRLGTAEKLKEAFFEYMSAWSAESAPCLLNILAKVSCSSVLDIGGGDGTMAIEIAKKFPSRSVTVWEIPHVATTAREKVDETGLGAVVSVIEGDFLADAFPVGHDCILFSHQLVIWSAEVCIRLLKQAFSVLPEQGIVVIFSSMTQEGGTTPLMAALDSVYFACLPEGGGRIYSSEEYCQWLRIAGFARTEVQRCDGWTPHCTVVGFK